MKYSSDYASVLSHFRAMVCGVLALTFGLLTAVQADTNCPPGQFVTGFTDGGSPKCAAIKASDVPIYGLHEISNGMVSNQSTDSTSGTANIKIPDGLGAGITDTLSFPGMGLAQKVWVSVTVNNSDLSGVRIELYGPGMADPYTLYNGDKTGKALTANFNSDTPIAKGDMNGDWVGKSIAGAWSITVKDLKVGGGAGGYDGSFNWSMNAQGLSNQQVQIKGNLIVNGRVSTATGLVIGGTAQPTHSLDATGDAWHRGQLVRQIARKVGYQPDPDDDVELAGRLLEFTKSKSDTSIRVVWMDNIRATGDPQRAWCRYEATLVVNNSGAAQPCSSPGPMWSGIFTDGHNHHVPGTQTWYCDMIAGAPIPAGKHSLRIRNSKQEGADCYTGWPNGQYSISVEEIY